MQQYSPTIAGSLSYVTYEYYIYVYEYYIYVYMINKMRENGVDCSVVQLLLSGVNIILLFTYFL